MTRIGRYRLGERLGRGGYGEVWRAVLDAEGVPRRDVALKVVPSREGLREARIGALLRHPNLVDVYEVGPCDDGWFCAMELCEGGTVRPHVPLPPRAVVEVALQICDALHYANQTLGLVHRDLKPENVLLSGATIKVADLGIAQAEGFAAPAVVAGTLAYMAPEQREALHVDTRADVYSLGLLLRELATGLRPPGPSETFSLEPDDVPRDVSDPLAVTPDWLRPVVARCLAADPARRFATMAHLAEALRRLPVTGPGLADVLDLRPTTRAESARMVGRRVELASLQGLMSQPGLVVLLGPAGVGKTLLARAAPWVARRWWADLTDVRDEVGLLQAVATALGLRVGPGDVALADRIGHVLAARGAGLLILDPVEHVDAWLGCVAAWVEGATALRVLATSRSRVSLPGARHLEVGPLPPDDARDLIVDRARQRGVVLDHRHEAVVRALAERLDHLPLALELAAGRLGVLSPAEVLERLEARAGLDLLRSGRVDAGARHASLAGALDWSWSLLDDTGREALGRLSIFRGGFRAEAAAGAGIPGPVLAQLVDRSLVVVDGERHRLLAPVRAHAAAHLADPDAARLAHARWFGILAADSVKDRRTAVSLLADYANLRSAAAVAVANDDVDLMIQIAKGLNLCREFGGLHPEDVDMGTRALEVPGHDVAVRADLHRLAGEYAHFSGRAGVARDHFEAALALIAGLDLLESEQALHAALCLMLPMVGELAAAAQHGERALALARTLGASMDEATANLNLGIIASVLGRYDEARERYLAVRRLLDDPDDSTTGILALANLGNVEANRGRPHEAVTILEEGLAIVHAWPGRRFELLFRGNLVNPLTHLGRRDEAHAHLRIAIGGARELGLRNDEASLLESLAQLHEDAADHAGAAEVREQALRLYRDLGNRRGEARTLSNLSNAYRIVAPERARGCLEQALAIHETLGVSRSAAICRVNLSQELADDGDLDGAIAMAEAGSGVLVSSGDVLASASSLALLADLHLRAGQVDRACDAVDRGEALIEGSGVLSVRIEILIQRARVEIASGEVDAPAVRLEQVRALAEEAGLAPGSGPLEALPAAESELQAARGP